VLNQLAAAGLAIHPSQHAAIGNRMDQLILRFQLIQIGPPAVVTME